MRSMNEFLDEFSRIGEELFQDIFSDRTIKRQVNLIIVSIMTVLISMSLINPTEASFQGLKFPTANAKDITYLFSIANFYMLIIFSFSAYRDWTLYTLKITRQAASINRLNAEHIKIFNERQRKLDKLFKDHSDILAARAELFEQRSEIDEKYREQIQSLSDQLNLSIEEGRYQDTNEIYEEIEHLYNQQERELKPFEELFEYIKNDNKPDKILDEIASTSNNNPESGRIDSILKMQRKFKLLRLFNKLLEIYMPVSLAVMSIVFSVVNAK